MPGRCERCRQQTEYSPIINPVACCQQDEIQRSQHGRFLLTDADLGFQQALCSTTAEAALDRVPAHTLAI